MESKNRHRVSNEELAKRLARRGLRLTAQRRVVLDAVTEAKGHPAAHEIYERARRVLPQISLGTVYRTLAVLRDAGIIDELHLNETQGRYEERGEPHHHVVCTGCGRIEDLDAKVFRGLTSRAQMATGFHIEDHRLEFYGRCPDCRSQGARPDLTEASPLSYKN